MKKPAPAPAKYPAPAKLISTLLDQVFELLNPVAASPCLQWRAFTKWVVQFSPAVSGKGVTFLVPIIDVPDMWPAGYSATLKVGYRISGRIFG